MSKSKLFRVIWVVVVIIYCVPAVATVVVRPPDIEDLAGQWVGTSGRHQVYVLDLDERCHGRLFAAEPSTMTSARESYDVVGCEVRGWKIRFSVTGGNAGSSTVRLNGETSANQFKLKLTKALSGGSVTLSLMRRERLDVALKVIDSELGPHLAGRARRFE